ncbi:MAG: cell division protein DedD [Escherichia coli]
MASKFQNRLVGTIVLVALGVIVLPGLLDGQKKHYQDEFAAIPLVPKAGDRDEPDMMPAATQALPTQPPEGAAEEVRAGDAAAPSLDLSRLATVNNIEIDLVPQNSRSLREAETGGEAAASPQRDKAAEQLAAVETPPPAKQDAAPTGRLRRSARYDNAIIAEIVSKRAARDTVFILHHTPPGKITRILVGRMRLKISSRFAWRAEANLRPERCGDELQRKLTNYPSLTLSPGRGCLLLSLRKAG